MGVPKLSQDVAPYAETAILGELPQNVTAIEVKKLVIDGPSMVYHVYNALLRAQNMEFGAASTLPSYRQINHCCRQFLIDLEASSAAIVKIFFDGALPTSKRQTRHDRLEKTRQQLETYRRVYPHPPFATFAMTYAGQPSPEGRESDDFRSVLWKQPSVASSRRYSLPPPPFMVASVIEFLRQSKWSDITVVVPGEADEFCAAEAVRSEGAVLSNDSDLLLYDLGTNGVLVLLHTLEVIGENEPRVSHRCKAHCLRPMELARRLGVPSMLNFGFQRSRDIGARSAVIAQRTREHLMNEDDMTWLAFRNEYCALTTASPSHVPKSIQNLDPRIAEIICSRFNSKSLHIYLPMVLEDPSRDSAWSYGFNIRRSAYSILFRHWDKKSADHPDSHVTEHSRRGARIGDNEVSCLSDVLLQQELETLSGIAAVCRIQMSDNVDTSTEYVPSRQDPSAGLQPMSMTVLSFHLLAACVVIVQRPRQAELHKKSCFRVFASTSSSGKGYTRRQNLRWEDLHFLAAVQCTLYSLRLLKQVVEYVNTDRDNTIRCDANVANLPVLLNSLPGIADLFLEMTGPRQSRSCCDKEYLEALFRGLDEFGNAVRDPDTSTNTPTTISGGSQEGEQVVNFSRLNAIQGKYDLSNASRVTKVKKASHKSKRNQNRNRPPAQVTQGREPDTENSFSILSQD